MHEPYTSSIQCVIREWLREDRGVSGGIAAATAVAGEAAARIALTPTMRMKR
jgi:hypothetical protein